MVDPVPNNKLSLSDLPHRDSPVIQYYLFAEGFDGYAYCGGFEEMAALSDRVYKAFQQNPASLSRCTLSELRACLYFEYRRFHNFGRDPNETEFFFWVSLVEEMERKIRAGLLD